LINIYERKSSRTTFESLELAPKTIFKLPKFEQKETVRKLSNFRNADPNRMARSVPRGAENHETEGAKKLRSLVYNP
jgi:hypothetical protein